MKEKEGRDEKVSSTTFRFRKGRGPSRLGDEQLCFFRWEALDSIFSASNPFLFGSGNFLLAGEEDTKSKATRVVARASDQSCQVPSRSSALNNDLKAKGMMKDGSAWARKGLMRLGGRKEEIETHATRREVSSFTSSAWSTCSRNRRHGFWQ